MSTICSDPCFRIVKSLSIGAGIGAAAGGTIGALTYVSLAAGAAAGAIFMVTTIGTHMLLEKHFSQELTELMKLIISVAAGILASIVVTPLLTGVSIGFGAAIVIDASSIAAMIGIRWLCSGQRAADIDALHRGM